MAAATRPLLASRLLIHHGNLLLLIDWGGFIDKGSEKTCHRGREESDAEEARSRDSGTGSSLANLVP